MPKISLIKPGTGSTQWGTDVGQNWTDIKIETVGQFMRFKIGLWEEKVNGDVTVIIGGNLMILGCGVVL